MNKVELIGNLTADPDVQHTKAGTAVCNVRLAHNRHYTQDGKEVKETTFVDIAIWGKTGENFAHFHRKGDLAAVFGYLRTDEWTDKNTGQRRSALKVTAYEWYFVGARKSSATDGTPAGADESSNHEPRNPPIRDDETPF